MSNNYYRIYTDATLKLVKTLAIKFDNAALAINNGLIEQYPTIVIDISDRTSWKYYQNIAGLYHHTDTVMTVTSLDDLSEIVFNKSSLAVNKATKQAYLYDTRYYRDLLNRYPDQELLIKAILYAPDDPDFINEVVQAKEGTVLYYAPEYVESNEESLIHKVQSWVYDYIERWMIGAYSITHDLYTALAIGQLYINMVPLVFNLRLAACKTNEAHSFHVRQYLASHGMLDTYLDVMTKKQALFFYRNILYIETHAGKRDTFDWLVDNVMTQRSLPLYEYTMKHDVSAQLPTEDLPNQLNYTPTPLFKRKALNVDDSTDQITEYSLSTMLSKLQPAAPGNYDYHGYHTDEIQQQLASSVSNIEYTKVLESVYLDNTNEAPYPLEQILLNNWIYLAAKGLYTTKISVLLEGTKKAISLSAKDALVLYIYAMNKAMELDVTEVPWMIAQRVPRLTAPTLNELMSIVDSEIFPESKVQRILDTYVAPTAIVSVETFYQTAHSLYEKTFLQYAYETVEENDNASGYAEMCISRLYHDTRVQLEPEGTLYSRWLTDRNIDLSIYTPSDYYALALTILDTVTGYTANASMSVKRIQKAMIEIMEKLSSYSVTFISDVASSSVRLVKGRPVKVNDVINLSVSAEYVELPVIDSFESQTQIQDTSEVDFHNFDIESLTSETASVSEITVDQFTYSQNKDPKMYMRQVELPIININGYGDPFDQYNSMTDVQKSMLVSIYE